MKQYHFEEQMAEQKAKLHLTVEIGKVAIETHNGRNLLIEAELEHMEIAVSRQENTVHVRVEQEEGWQNIPRKLLRLLANDHPKAIVTVHVPADCEVYAKIVTGSLTINGVEAPVTTDMVTGKTVLTNLGGPVNAKTVTGKMAYHGILTNDHHRFEAVTGSICLSLKKEPNARLDASTVTGHVACDFLPGKQVKRRNVTGAELRGTLGSGEGYIKAQVVTGSLRLESVALAGD